MKTPKISIAIPTYECKGDGWLFLSELLNSILKQKYIDYQVVVSDQSTDDRIIELCEFYRKSINLKLVNARDVSRGVSTNTNNAIKYCDGQYIKPMMMDEFFISDMALDKIANAMDSSKSEWLVSGVTHCESINFLHTPMIPKYNDSIHLGMNTISSPSVLTMRNKHYFDEKLTMLMDCEMYKRLHTLYGEFCLISEYLVCSRRHKNQASNFSQHLLSEEKEYCRRLYENSK